VTPRSDSDGETQTPSLRMIGLSLQFTLLFVAASVLTYLVDGTLDLAYALACSAVFFVGVGLVALGMWNGIQRSRTDEVTLTGLVAIDTSHVSRTARNRLWSAIVVQIVVSITLASLRPFTQQAFGLLVPTFGLGIATLWGSRFAAFHPRDDH